MLKRTTKPGSTEKKIRMINYYDKNKAQRWGRIEKEHKDHIVVKNAYGEKEKVPREKIIGEDSMIES